MFFGLPRVCSFFSLSLPNESIRFMVDIKATSSLKNSNSLTMVSAVTGPIPGTAFNKIYLNSSGECELI